MKPVAKMQISPFKKILLAVLCVALLSSCTTKVAYHFLDFGIAWYLGKYVSLDNQQKEYVKTTLDEFHQWHRQTQLPQYANFLQAFQDSLQHEISGDMLHAETDKAQVLLDQSISYLFPHGVKVISTFSDEQEKEILKNFEKEREKYYKKRIDVDREEVIKARIKELKDFISPYIGRMSKEQKQWTEDWAQSLVPFEELTYAQQELWAQQLQEVLDKRNDEVYLRKHMEQLFASNTDQWPQETQQVYSENQRITYDFMANLINSLNPEQRQKMNRKLSNLIQDLRELAGSKQDSN